MQMTAALDNFESEDEADAEPSEGMEPAAMELDTTEAAAQAGSRSLFATGRTRGDGSNDRGAGEVHKQLSMNRGKRGAAKTAGGRAKRVKVDAVQTSPPGAVADELVLDSEYVMGPRGRQGHGACSSVVAGEEGWEAGAASNIRLLARMQAYQSLRAAHSSAACREANPDGCASLSTVQPSARTAPSLAAVDELLRVFEAVHKRLGLHVEQAV